jgi:DUF1680 family protein
MRNYLLVLLFFFTASQILANQTTNKVDYLIPNKIKDLYHTSPSVKMTGLLDERVIINLEKRLLNIDTAILLSGFVHRPGSQSWIGEHVGKFLYYAANSYRYSQDRRIKKLMDDVVRKYIATQLPNGYLGTYLPEKYWKSWDVWAHKYAIIGLLQYYSVTGNPQALKTAIKAADLICRVFGDQEGQLDLNNAGYQKGMASGSILEPMIDLYRYTGNQKYLNFAKYIFSVWETETGPKIFSTLQKYGTVTKIANAKSYEMLSCFVGILKYYRLTGEKGLLKPMENAWEDITKHHLYITGTTSSDEVFKEDHFLPADSISQMGEGCVTTTWVQFNEQLLMITGAHKYVEEIEKSFYNHLLAAQSPVTGCVSFYTLLQGPKTYKCDDGQSCCLSSISRGISMIPDMVCGKINGIFSVLVYEPGNMRDSIKAIDGEKIGLNIKSNSDFPISGDIKYLVNPSKTKQFKIKFNIPSWSTDFSITINDEKQSKIIEEDFYIVNRVWKKSDVVKIHFNMPISTIYGAPTYKEKIAFKKGPQVLAMDIGLNLTLADTIGYQLNANWLKYPENSTNNLPVTWIGKQAYLINLQIANKSNSILLVPFADAGQQGAFQKVWLPISEIRKN